MSETAPSLPASTSPVALYATTTDTIGLPAIQEAAHQVFRVKLTPESVGTTQKLEGIRGAVVLAHIGNENWGRLSADAHAGEVRLRIGSSGYPEGNTEPIRRQSGAYVLLLCPQAASLATGDWVEIFKALSNAEVLQALAANQNPGGLRRYFFTPMLDLLSALVTHCQGYLAVIAHDPDSLNEAERLAPTEDAKAAIRTELTDVFKLLGLGADPTRDADVRFAVGDFRKRGVLVRSATWWRTPFCPDPNETSNASWKNLVKDVKTQWDLTALADGWKHVEKLVAGISVPKAEGSIDAETIHVARAYLALAQIYKRKAS